MVLPGLPEELVLDIADFLTTEKGCLRVRPAEPTLQQYYAQLSLPSQCKEFGCISITMGSRERPAVNRPPISRQPSHRLSGQLWRRNASPSGLKSSLYKYGTVSFR